MPKIQHTKEEFMEVLTQEVNQLKDYVKVDIDQVWDLFKSHILGNTTLQ